MGLSRVRILLLILAMLVVGCNEGLRPYKVPVKENSNSVPNLPPVSSNPYPAPNHPLDFGYYYADGRYGNFTSEVYGYTNLNVQSSGGYDSQATWDNPNAALDIRRLFDASLRSDFNAGKKIFMMAGGEDEWDAVLDTARPYWSAVKYVQLFHEEATVSRADAEAKVSRYISKLAQKGLSKPLLTALESPGAEQASNIDVVEIEAYIPPPFNQDDATNQQRMNNIINSRKASVVPGKNIMFVMMAYDRNGQWPNIETLKKMQDPCYLASYNDTRVLGITLFSYSRPGGSRDHPELKYIHQLMAQRILNL